MLNIIILCIVLLFAALSVFLIDRLIRFLLKRKLAENGSPITIPVLIGVLFVSAALLLSGIVSPTATTYEILSNSHEGQGLFFRWLSYCCVYYAINLIVLVVIFLSANVLHGVLTKGENILYEVTNNNISSVIFFSALIIALTIASREGVLLVIDECIPYPNIPNYR